MSNFTGQGIAHLLNAVFPGFWKRRRYRTHRYVFWGGFAGLFAAVLYKDSKSFPLYGVGYDGDVPLEVVFAFGIGAGLVAGWLLAILVKRLFPEPLEEEGTA